MRYRPKNLRGETPDILNQLAKFNPYIARVYDYPEFLLPHPTVENFQEMRSRKTKGNFRDALPGKVHIEIGCGSSRFLIEFSQLI
jgi:tRNA G46 methylase TrmB